MLVTQHDDAAFDRPDSTDSFYELSSALDNNDVFVVYNKKTEKNNAGESPGRFRAYTRVFKSNHGVV